MPGALQQVGEESAPLALLGRQGVLPELGERLKRSHDLMQAEKQLSDAPHDEHSGTEAHLL